MKKEVNNKRKSKLPIFIVIGIVVLIVIILIICLSKGNSDTDRKVSYSDAYFLKEESNYALFNKDGKKLTGFDFTYVGVVKNGSALVKKGDESGIISSNGKMIVKFGKYKNISTVGGLYKAVDSDNNTYLLDSKGKVIADLKDVTMTNHIGDETFTILYEKNNKVYKIYNSKGNMLTSFKGTDSETEKPRTNQDNGFISIYYNNMNYILDGRLGEKVLEFKDSKHYCINNSTDDGSIITMNSCSTESQEKTTYKFIKDGKLYDLNDKCDKVQYISGNLVCTKDNKQYLLDSKVNVGIAIDSVSYIDNNHYAKLKDGSFNGVDVYSDGKLKNIECRTIKDYGYSKSGYYVLGTYYSTKCNTTSGKYEFYDKDGNKMFDKTFERINNFDNNSLARVSENKTSYYLINTKGKKVSDEYDSISNNYDNYIVTKNNLKGILNSKGKLVIEPKYKSADIYEIQGVKYAKLTTEDKKYVIYNIDNNKKIMTLDTNPSLAENYIYTITDGKKTYYTYKGKEIYKEK